MCCSLIEEGKDIQQKLKTVLGYWERLIGHESPVEINEEMYKSESGKENFSLFWTILISRFDRLLTLVPFSISSTFR